MNMITAENTPYGLGRLPEWDNRNRGFAAVDLLPATAKLRTYYHIMRPPLDQGKSPMCVDYSLNTCLMGSPKVLRSAPEPPGTIYRLAQTLDQWQGENYDGTSVLAGEKAGVQLGLFKEYRWMLTFNDILLMLANYGPVVIGSNWYEGMFTPNSNGEVNISGSIAGGHAYCLCGINIKDGRVRMLNSWGSGWGQNGRAWINFDTLERLFGEDGEAALPVQQTIR